MWNVQSGQLTTITQSYFAILKEMTALYYAEFPAGLKQKNTCQQI